MPKDLSKVQNIVITYLENRSFDHILGYLGLADSGHPRAARIEGIQHAQTYYAHDAYPVRAITSPTIDPDPPHERKDIATEIVALGGAMKGFASTYRKNCPNADPGRVMEYVTKGYLPTTDFLARKGAICDNWFSCIPASTLPNRLMAMSGYALIDLTPNNYLQDAENLFYDHPDDLVYDWLEQRSGWRLYYSGSFFFMQMPRLLEKWEGDQQAQALFRPLDQLVQDFSNGDIAPVTFIEPLYQDDPRKGTAQATDDHAPASLYGAQRFLKIVHEAVTKDAVWNNLVWILSYDEHGSIFDHVPPPRIRTDPPANARYSRGYETLGVRVPAIVLSPFVRPGDLCESLFDHTSVLKFLGEKFGGGRYTDIVDNRPVESLSAVLRDEILSGAEPVTPAPRMT